MSSSGVSGARTHAGMGKDAHERDAAGAQTACFWTSVSAGPQG